MSVDQGKLRGMHFLGQFKDISPNTAVGEFTSDEVETSVRGMVKKDDKTYDRANI